MVLVLVSLFVGVGFCVSCAAGVGVGWVVILLALLWWLLLLLLLVLAIVVLCSAF